MVMLTNLISVKQTAVYNVDRCKLDSLDGVDCSPTEDTGFSHRKPVKNFIELFCWTRKFCHAKTLDFRNEP